MFWLGWYRWLGPLPGAVLSCFGKKVPKEGGYWGGAGVEPFWLVGPVAWVARLEATLP